MILHINLIVHWFVTMPARYSITIFVLVAKLILHPDTVITAQREPNIFCDVNSCVRRLMLLALALVSPPNSVLSDVPRDPKLPSNRSI